MNIAITASDWMRVTASAETCQNFLVYEIGAGIILNKHTLSLEPEEVLAIWDIKHENHPLDGILVLISASMGRSMERQLKKIGITPFVTEEKSPDEAIKHYLKGDLLVEPAGFHREHNFHMLKDEKNYAPTAGTRTLHNID
jgi:predicted Fe-Mo cluster-binding NifX family protein